jgi:peptidyl-prolyl cis-trans isomerase SurA
LKSWSKDLELTARILNFVALLKNENVMKYSVLIFAFLSLFTTAARAQDDKSTLVTLNNRDFTVGEFKQVYFKNLDLVKQQEERSLHEYLDLFNTREK